jgi:hypothetical protein
MFTGDGAVIIRFLTAPSVSEINSTITNDATNEQSHELAIMQFEWNRQLETIARVCFQTDGRYTVSPFGGETGNEILKRISGTVYSPKRWRFEGKGSPCGASDHYHS